MIITNIKEDEDFIRLIYELNEFSEKSIIEQYIANESSSFTTNLGKFRDYLFTLCDIGTLQYDGDFFKVIPPTERLSYRKFFFRGLA